MTVRVVISGDNDLPEFIHKWPKDASFESAQSNDIHDKLVRVRDENQAEMSCKCH